MKYYHVIIEPNHGYFEDSKKAAEMKSQRREIICPNKVRCPNGWRIVGVCGYHEK